MKLSFYPRLAWTGMWKNRRLYIPYLLTCIGMFTMFYIIAFLAHSPLLSRLPGSITIQSTFVLGQFVIGLFAIIFLFYTNSFLIRRRKKEFGLYNILGMGKRNLSRIMIWETATIFVVSFLIGTICGIAFSKFAELLLVNIMGGDVTYSLSISFTAILEALILFVVIFFLIFLNTLRQVLISNPAALMRSEQFGEMPPKANWILGLAGLVMLIAAYWIAVSIQNPVEALLWFFVAVILVILATYLLFIAGSVLLCRILQKRKNYYYKAAHFVSVSSMSYRMKRNGAGLASICILGTMVLVMISSTSCLYLGSEDALRTRYSRDLMLEGQVTTVEAVEDTKIEPLRRQIAAILEDAQTQPTHVQDYRTATLTGALIDGAFQFDVTEVDSLHPFDHAVILRILPLSDYNRMTGLEETLQADQVIVHTHKMKYALDTIRFCGNTYQVKPSSQAFELPTDSSDDVLPVLTVVAPDFSAAVAPLMELRDYNQGSMATVTWFYNFDVGTSPEETVELFDQIVDLAKSLRDGDASEDETGDSLSHLVVYCRDIERSDYYGTFGSLLFLGILLSIAFLFAAVLIIYYKQICEGYEDQARFAIMQKVGLSKRDIRRSVNSQMLTVFFLPLLTAGLHLFFAFPMVRKILMLFSLTNLPLLICTTIGSLLVFAVFYALVYRITSNAYYNIVSSNQENRI